MKKYAILGYPLKHTMSPPIHKRLFELSGIKDVSYEIKEISPDELNSKIDELNQLDGYNITIPHKVEIIKYTDKLDETASRYNSVNCISNVNGVRTGYNTDCYGFLRALEAGNAKLDGKILQIGCGGVGRTMVIESVLHGAEVTVVVLPNYIESANEVAAEAKKLCPDAKINIITEKDISGSFDLLINATPVGMYPEIDNCPVSEDVIKNCACVFEAIYNPDVTKLMSLAEKNNIPAIGGMAMLVWQAVVAHEIWDGSKYSDADINTLIADMRAALVN